MADLQSDNKRIAKNTIFLYFRMLFVLAVSLYTTRIILQVLGVEDYGVYNVVGGFVSMFGFLNTSLVGAIQRFYNYETNKNGDTGFQSVYITSMFIQGLLSIIILVLLESFGIWYVNHVMVVPPERLFAANILFQSSALSLVLVIMQVPYSAAVMSFEKMDYYAVVGIIEVILKLAIVVVLPYIVYDKLITYGLAILTIHAICFMLYFIYAKRHFKAMKLQFQFNKSQFASMLSFSGWNVFGTLSGMLKGQGLNMLLNAYFGPVVNAARGISYQIMSALQQFSLNIVAAFRPQLVNSYANNNFHRTKTIMYSESKICFCLMCLFIVPLIIELRYVLHLWLGDIIPDNTIAFTVIVLIIMTVSTLNTPLTQVIHAAGRLRKYMLVTGTITCAIVPLSWIFLELGFGPLCVFVVSLVMTFVNQVASIIVVREVLDYDIKEYLRVVVMPCLTMILILPIIPVFVHSLMNESFVRLLCVCIIDVIMFCLIGYFSVLNDKERFLVTEFFKRKVKRL